MRSKRISRNAAFIQALDPRLMMAVTPVITVHGGTTVQAGSAVFVDAVTSTTYSGGVDRRLTSKFQWSFGDTSNEGTHTAPSGLSYDDNSLSGWTGAHVFDTPSAPGTPYTVTLTVTEPGQSPVSVQTSITVTAPPSTFKDLYVTNVSPGSASGSGSRSAPMNLQGLKNYLNSGATARGTDIPNIRFKNGETFDLSALFPAGLTIDRDKTVISSWDPLTTNPARPILSLPASSTAKNIITIDTGRSRATIENLKLIATGTYAQPYSERGVDAIEALNNTSYMTIRNNEFDALDHGLHTNDGSNPQGYLFQDNFATGTASIRKYLIWGEGRDWTVLGNKVLNATKESVVRFAHFDRATFSYNFFKDQDLDGNTANDVDKLKAAFVLQAGIKIGTNNYENNAWVSNNTFEATQGGNAVAEGPLTLSQGNPEERNRYTVYENNTINGQMQIYHGDSDTVIRNNLIKMNAGMSMSGILVEPHQARQKFDDPADKPKYPDTPNGQYVAYDRGVFRLRIYANTIDMRQVNTSGVHGIDFGYQEDGDTIAYPTLEATSDSEIIGNLIIPPSSIPAGTRALYLGNGTLTKVFKSGGVGENQWFSSTTPVTANALTAATDYNAAGWNTQLDNYGSNSPRGNDTFVNGTYTGNLPDASADIVSAIDGVFTDIQGVIARPSTMATAGAYQRPSSASAPTAPSGLVASAASDKIVNLTWVDNSNNETSFSIDRRIGASGAWAPVAGSPVGVDVHTFTDTTTVQNTTYNYRVTAINTAGSSASNIASVLTPAAPTAPNPPTNVSAYAASATSVVVGWTASATATSYRVERRLGLSGSWASVGTTTTATSYTDNTASANTNYNYRVFAVNSNGDSLESAIASVTTPVVDTYTSANIGSPTGNNTTTPIVVGKDYNMNAGGTDIFGTSDSFRFHYIPLSGDFDYSVKIISLTASASGLESKAGLMARASLAADSVNVFSRWGLDNAFKGSVRATTGGTTTSSTVDNGSLPNIYVRLQRVNDVFTAYSSDDGSTWVVEKTVTVAMGTSVYFGMAVSARSTAGDTASVQFRNLTDRAAPLAPTNAAVAVNLATPSATITWTDNATNETSYRVERRLASGSTWTTVASSLAANSNTYTDATVTSGETYAYRVVVVNSNSSTSANSSEVIASVAPLTVSQSEFRFETGQSFAVTFSSPINTATLSASDLVVTQYGTNTQFTPDSVTYDAATNTAVFNFTTLLDDGYYISSIADGSLSNTNGNALTGSFTSPEFMVYGGDFTRDGTVNFDDLVILAQNYNLTPRTFSEGDNNYDGVVNDLDLAVLSKNYDKTLSH